MDRVFDWISRLAEKSKRLDADKPGAGQVNRAYLTRSVLDSISGTFGGQTSLDSMVSGDYKDEMRPAQEEGELKDTSGLDHWFDRR